LGVCSILPWVCKMSDKKSDLFEKLGFDKELCPKCKAHLRNKICLNGCQLSPEGQERLRRMSEDIILGQVKP